MARSFSETKRIRKSFGRVPEVAPMPNLIEVQKSSYDHFLQMAVIPEQRGECRAAGGLQVGLPDPRFLRARSTRIRPLRAGDAEIRRRRVPAARHHLRRAAEGHAPPRRLGCRRGYRLALDPRHQGAGRLHGRHAADDEATAPSSSTAPSASSSRRCIAARASSSTTTRARRTPPANTCSPRGSSPIAAPGSISSSTPRTTSMCASTGRRKLPATTLLLALDDAATEALRARRRAEDTARCSPARRSGCPRRRSCRSSTTR